MNKIPFNYLYSFKYNNKNYIYLYNKNYPFYILEYQNNNFIYPDYTTYKDLYTKFNVTTYYAYDKRKTYLKLKQKLMNIPININPLIRTTSGLISLSLAISLCGCSKTTTINNNPISNSSISSSKEEETPSKEEEITNYFNKYNIKINLKEYDNNDYIFVKEYINEDNISVIYIDSIDEFKNIYNLKKSPTYDDVINAFKENNNIDDEKKSLIINYINKMKDIKELKDLDLSLLYLNAKRMSINYLSKEEIEKNTNRSSVYAYFDPLTSIVTLPKNEELKEFEFIHEVIGHASLTYNSILNNKKYIYDCTNKLMLLNDNQYTSNTCGIMISEGGANLIAHLITNDYTVDTFYELYEEEIRVISQLCNISIGELLNNKGISLYDLMYKNNINTPVEYIFKADAIYYGKLYCEFTEIMERLTIDKTYEEFISSDKTTQEEIINNTLYIINNSYFKTPLVFKYNTSSMEYDYNEVSNYYEEYMNNLKK